MPGLSLRYLLCASGFEVGVVLAEELPNRTGGARVVAAVRAQAQFVVEIHSQLVQIDHRHVVGRTSFLGLGQKAPRSHGLTSTAFDHARRRQEDRLCTCGPGRLHHRREIGLEEGRPHMPRTGRIPVVDAELNEQVVASLHATSGVGHVGPTRIIAGRCELALAVAPHGGADVGIVEPGLNAPSPDCAVDHRHVAVEECVELTSPTAGNQSYSSVP